MRKLAELYYWTETDLHIERVLQKGALHPILYAAGVLTQAEETTHKEYGNRSLDTDEARVF
jgi:hypothetical protein